MSGETFVHSSALVETSEIGEGTRVWAFAHVMEGAVIGADCKIGDHSFIESGAVLGDRVVVKNNSLIWHGVIIGDDVFVGPNTVFTNVVAPRARYQTSPEDWEKTEVADRVTIGANSTIISGIRLGYNCMIGAGSVVTKDVQDHGLVFGNPARPAGWVCDCGQKLEDLACPACWRTYRTSPNGLAQVPA